MSLANKPAFPENVAISPAGDVYTSCNIGAPGMNLLEHFAGLAMQGFCANSGSMGAQYGPSGIASRSVEIAIALIAELEKERSK